jgi:nucleolar protein 12
LTAPDTETDDTSAGVKRSAKKVKIKSNGDSNVGSTPGVKPKSEKKKKTKGEKGHVSEVDKAKGTSGEKEAGRDRKGKKKHTAEPVFSEGEDGDKVVPDNEQNPSSSDSDDGERYVPPVHESLATAPGPAPGPSSKKAKKYVPPDETPEQRDSRTIFVGNVPSQVMTAKVSWRI